MTVSVLGITGPIGSGKSTVAKMTRELGAIDVIDADRVTHELMEPETRVTEAIMRAFGDAVLDPSGAICRSRLGDIVFRDPAALRRLEAIVHPEVRLAVEARIDCLRNEQRQGVVTLEAIRLLDSPLVKLCSAVWLVTCSPQQQSDRLQASRGYSVDEVRRRTAAQPDFDMGRVSEDIANDVTVDALRLRVEGAWNRAFTSPREPAV